MRHYGKSQLVECNPDFGGIRVPMQARLSLRKNPDGTVSIVPHPIRREPNLDEYLNVKFTPEDQDNLKKTGNLGRVAEVVDPATGELIPSFISIDRLTNETVAVPVSAIRIPDEVKGVKLDPEQKAALSRGEGVYVEGMTAKSGKKFNATLQINADKRGLDFHFGGQKKAQRQEQTQIYEVKPDTASRTQVAVNSEGKTDEATKHIGEPLQRGQTAPANEEQQRRQQNANKPRMRM